MDGIYLILIIFGAGALCASFTTYKLLSKKNHEKLRKLELEAKKTINETIEEKDEAIERYKNRDVLRDAEHGKLLAELNKTIEFHKDRSKSILNKAVDFAFDFERIFKDQHQNAQTEIQRVLDDTYRFKKKVLLSSISLKNFERKLEDIKKESFIYQSLIAKYDYFELIDNSDWDSVEDEFRNKVLNLQAA